MKIETKFNCGDKVWQIHNGTRAVLIKCPFCGGTGTIVGADGTSQMCPKCYGKKNRTEHKPVKWRVAERITIGQVRAKYTGESEGDQDTIFDNYGPQSEKYTEKYMCEETGIGSGTLYYVHTLFADKSEAQVECDRLNAEAEKEAA